MNIKTTINLNFVDNIKDIIKDSKSYEIKSFLELLPNNGFHSYGFSFINAFYKEMSYLEDQKQITKNIKELQEIERKQKIVYWIYSELNYDKVYLSYDNFLVFSKLLCATFNDYNPNIQRERDDKTFVSEEYYESIEEKKQVEFIIDRIAYEFNHSEHPHAFEIDKTRLEILIDILWDKYEEVKDNILSDIDMNKYMDYFDKIIVNKSSNQKIKEYVKKMSNKGNIK